MDLVTTVVLLMISCLSVQVEGSETVCVKCTNCKKTTSFTFPPPTDGITFVGGLATSCSTEDGFCTTNITKIEGEDDVIERDCSTDREKYDQVGCMTDGENIQVCRCDESHCNTKYEDLHIEDLTEEGMVVEPYPGSCLTEDGFCITKVTKIEGFDIIERDCSEERDKNKVGCFMEGKEMRVCLCAESNCNTNYEELTTAAPRPTLGTLPTFPDESPSVSTGIPWWLILAIVLVSASCFLMVLVSVCLKGGFRAGCWFCVSFFLCGNLQAAARRRCRQPRAYASSREDDDEVI